MIQFLCFERIYQKLFLLPVAMLCYQYTTI